MFLFCLVFAIFVRVCLYVLRGHLLGKGWPLGSRLWCLLWVCHFPIGILGQVWYLIVSIPDLCNLTYFYTSYSRSRNSPACSLHIYWYSVRLSSLLPFYKICMIFQLSSAYSTHQAEQNKHFSPFFGVKLTMPPSSGYSTHPAQLTTYAT